MYNDWFQECGECSNESWQSADCGVEGVCLWKRVLTFVVLLLLRALRAFREQKNVTELSAAQRDCPLGSADFPQCRRLEELPLKSSRACEAPAAVADCKCPGHLRKELPGQRNHSDSATTMGKSKAAKKHQQQSVQQPTPPTQDEAVDESDVDIIMDSEAEKDEAEAELERLVFGDEAGFREGLRDLGSEDEDRDEDAGEGAVRTGLEGLDDADVGQILRNLSAVQHAETTVAFLHRRRARRGRIRAICCGRTGRRCTTHETARCVGRQRR